MGLRLITMNVCLMLKAPRPGFVKTRLARDLGDDEATAAYRLLVEAQMRALPAAWDVRVAFAPDNAAAEMREWLGSGLNYFPQCDGDLGDRLTHAAQTIPGPLIFLGGDCPELTTSRLEAAATELESADIVIWPALDGGYCLLGIKKLIPEIFQEIAWGTETVFRETLARIPTGLSVRQMSPALEDVDDLASWQRALGSGCMQTR